MRGDIGGAIRHEMKAEVAHAQENMWVSSQSGGRSVDCCCLAPVLLPLFVSSHTPFFFSLAGRRRWRLGPPPPSPPRRHGHGRSNCCRGWHGCCCGSHDAPRRCDARARADGGAHGSACGLPRAGWLPGPRLPPGPAVRAGHGACWLPPCAWLLPASWRSRWCSPLCAPYAWPCPYLLLRPGLRWPAAGSL